MRSRSRSLDKNNDMIIIPQVRQARLFRRQIRLNESEIKRRFACNQRETMRKAYNNRDYNWKNNIRSTYSEAIILGAQEVDRDVEFHQAVSLPHALFHPPCFLIRNNFSPTKCVISKIYFDPPRGNCTRVYARSIAHLKDASQAR